MKPYQMLWSSISVLIAAVIAVLAFIRGFWQFWLLLAVFAVWGIWAFLTFLLPVLRRKLESRKVRSQPAAPRASVQASADTPDPRLEGVLLCHVNYRISAYLKSAFPDARWEWQTKAPAQLIQYGGVGRIQIYGVPDYNYAEVTLSPRGGIQCALVKITPIPTPDESAEEMDMPQDKEPLDPQVWFEVHGRRVLEKLIADLDSRGYNSLSIQQDGSIVVDGQDGNKPCQSFSSFPAQVYWPQLIQVLEREGYAAEEGSQAIGVAW